MLCCSQKRQLWLHIAEQPVLEDAKRQMLVQQINPADEVICTEVVVAIY